MFAETPHHLYLKVGWSYPNYPWRIQWMGNIPCSSTHSQAIFPECPNPWLPKLWCWIRWTMFVFHNSPCPILPYIDPPSSPTSAGTSTKLWCRSSSSTSKLSSLLFIPSSPPFLHQSTNGQHTWDDSHHSREWLNWGLSHDPPDQICLDLLRIWLEFFWPQMAVIGPNSDRNNQFRADPTGSTWTKFQVDSKWNLTFPSRSEFICAFN